MTAATTHHTARRCAGPDRAARGQGDRAEQCRVLVRSIEAEAGDRAADANSMIEMARSKRACPTKVM